MSKSAIGIGVVVLAAGGATIYVQSRANAALQREIGALRAEVRAAVGAMKSEPGMAPSTLKAVPPQISDGATTSTRRAAQDGELAKLREESRHCAKEVIFALRAKINPRHPARAGHRGSLQFSAAAG